MTIRTPFDCLFNHYLAPEGNERPLDPPDMPDADTEAEAKELQADAMSVLVAEFQTLAPEAFGNASEDFYNEVELAWQDLEAGTMLTLIDDMLLAHAEAVVKHRRGEI